MSRLYGPQHRALQDRFDMRRLADGVERRIVATEISAQHRKFIESRDMFWLATIDHQGRPTVSYKGGDPGFVRVLDQTTIAFPCYDGNGMLYSMGNLMGNNKVGMLFVNFEQPHRLRVQGIATVRDDDPLLADFLEAQMIVRVSVTEIFRNCPPTCIATRKSMHRNTCRGQEPKRLSQDGNGSTPCSRNWRPRIRAAPNVRAALAHVKNTKST